MDNCIFCKIVAGEIPAKLVGESDFSLAFNDISPKQHHENVSALSFDAPDQLVDLIQLGSRLAAEHSTGSFRLQFNTGSEAGQSVFHAHGHIMSSTPKSGKSGSTSEAEALG